MAALLLLAYNNSRSTENETKTGGDNMAILSVKNQKYKKDVHNAFWR